MALRPGLGLSQDWDEDEEEVACNVALVEIACDCQFFRAWRLPCRHMLHHHLQLSSLRRIDIWRDWACKWEDSGFETYEAYEILALDRGRSPSLSRRLNDSLPGKPLMSAERLLLEQQALQQLGPVDGKEFIGWWIKKLQVAAASVNGMDFDAWCERRKDYKLDIIHSTVMTVNIIDQLPVLNSAIVSMGQMYSM